MNSDNYVNETLFEKELTLIQKGIKEYISLLCNLCSLKDIDFYIYDYEYNNFSYEYSVVSNEKNIDFKKELILSDGQITFGKLLIENEIENSFILEIVLNFLNKKLLEHHDLLKQRYNDESSLNIFIVYDEESKYFSNILDNDLTAILNTNITSVNNIKNIVEKLNLKSTRTIVIYLCSSYDNIKKDEKDLNELNDYIIVYGPNEHRIPLLCGTLNIKNFLSFDDYDSQILKEIIFSTKNTLLNKYANKNNIITFSGISGGVGTTSISMNFANILAKELTTHNILYIDLSLTKAISNLFLTKNPLPQETIIDLINSNEFNIENNLKNGLVKIKNNFFTINGIQKHIDKSYLEQDVFIQKFLDYINKASEYFNFIIIDAGVFESSSLKTTLYDISNNIDLIIEMNLPDISKLKTLNSLVKRAGLKEKMSYIINKYDEKNSLKMSDALTILSMNEKEKIEFKFKISNNTKILDEYWNNCELISDVCPNCLFNTELKEFLLSKKLIDKNTSSKGKNYFSFF